MEVPRRWCCSERQWHHRTHKPVSERKQQFAAVGDFEGGRDTRQRPAKDGAARFSRTRPMQQQLLFSLVARYIARQRGENAVLPAKAD